MLWCCPLTSLSVYPTALRKFSFAVMMVPSRLNSITACALLMASIIALRIGGKFAQLGDVIPLENVAVIYAILVVGGAHAKRKGKRAHHDVGAVREVGGIGQQAALMRRVLVEHVDAGADHVFRIEIPGQLLEMLAVLGQKGLGGLVHVGDLEIPVDQHGRVRNDVESLAQLLVELARLSIRAGRSLRPLPRACAL